MADDYIWGTGRRKNSVAGVRIRPGTGVIQINGKDVEDYSTLPNGPYFRNTYPPQADHSNFPAWSWDRVQRWGSVHNGSLDPDYIRAMANNHQIVSVGNTFADGGFEAAEAIKKVNPETRGVSSPCL